MSNNIDWRGNDFGSLYREIMCRIAIWFLDRANIKIVEWVVFKEGEL